MFERILFALAAIAAIAGFLLEAWRSFKDFINNRKPDDVRKRKKR